MSVNLKGSVLPLPVRRSLIKLGQDLALARRRRRISTSSMAERIQISTATLRRLERGDPSVSIGTFAQALFVLNAIDRFAGVAGAGQQEGHLSEHGPGADGEEDGPHLDAIPGRWLQAGGFSVDDQQPLGDGSCLLYTSPSPRD